MSQHATTEPLARDPLLDKGMQWLLGGQQLYDADQAALDSPRTFAARRHSRTAFENLSPLAAARLALKDFPAAVGQPAAGPPPLSLGEHVARYLSPTIAQLDLPDHRRAAVESFGGPMAMETSRGHFAPLDLALAETGEGFVPRATRVPVRIPKRLVQGVTVDDGGVSITPVAADGHTLSGSAGVEDGASVLYANTQTDTDTVAKPTSSGFELSTILRSIASPSTFYYRVHAPGDGHLKQTNSGAVQVSVHGRIVGVLLPPSAVDAAGSPVPVSMHVAGTLLVLHLLTNAGEHTWPIDVDPYYSAIDEELEGGCTHGPGWVEEDDGCTEGHTNWHFIADPPFVDESCYCKVAGVAGNGYIKWRPDASYNGGEYAGILYNTQGESRIYAFRSTSEGTYASPAWVSMEILTHEGHERKMWTYLNPYETGEYATTATICAEPSETYPHTCEPSEGTEGNEARFQTATTAPGGAGAFSQEVSKAWVWVAQAHPPTASFNTTSTEVTTQPGVKRPNVLYQGGESWLGPYSGALEMTATDPGVGVSSAVARDGDSSVWAMSRLWEGKCAGLQCKSSLAPAPSEPASLTYNSRMEGGEHSLELTVYDALGLSTTVTHTLKVAKKMPSDITVDGLGEISAAPHTLTIEAADYLGRTYEAAGKSPGVKSLSVKLDGGREVSVPGASCSPGNCIAKGEYLLHAEDLPEGMNRLVVTATDYANNPAAKEFTFDVRHASPVSVGPGTVDPTTGQLTLTATDVSLGGMTAVKRIYQSRNPDAGAEGPLGPQWTMNLGASESLTVLPDGSVSLTASGGGRTTFEREEDGSFESPPGDSNLKLEGKEAEAGAGISEYVIKDESAGSAVRYTQPSGTQQTAPSFSNQFGSEGSQLDGPAGLTVDAKGDVWVADSGDDRILEFSAAGVLMNAYGSEGSDASPDDVQFLHPSALALNQTTGDIYVADEGNHRIVELSATGEFIETFGWGVSKEKQGFAVCKSECQAGSDQTTSLVNGNDFVEPNGIAVDSSGNVWVSDAAADRVKEFSATGEYLQQFGKEGTGAGELKQPSGIAVSGTTVYVAEYGNDRVQEFAPSLGQQGRLVYTYAGQFGKQGIGGGEFAKPQGIAIDPRTGSLYVADSGNHRVQEFSPSGQLIAKFGAYGSEEGEFSEPVGVTVSAAGAIYVSDALNNRLEEWMRSSWLPTVSEGTLESGTTTRAYAPLEVEAGKTILVPSEAPAPAPVGITCGKEAAEMQNGCRALLFKYGKETTAGEAPGEWGEYRGRLMSVLFAAYNPTSGKLEEKPVADYAYDKQGRLRAEWDPRISPALKTTYGYDSAGHVVAMTPPGQEPWLFRYGALDGDPNTGRLLSVTRPPAGKPSVLKEEQALSAPVDEGAPTVSSTSSGSGELLSSSHGGWSNRPLAYSYQWEDCEASGQGKCTPIIGAVNETYTVQQSDIGFKLRTSVSAENEAGATTAVSPETGVTQDWGQGCSCAPAPPKVGDATVYTLAYHLPLSGESVRLPSMTSQELAKWGQTKDLPSEGMAIFPPDTPMGWPAQSYERATITYLDEKGRAVNIASPLGAGQFAISTSEYNEDNELERTLSPDDRAAALASPGESAAIAERLDTKRTYNVFGKLTETLGPEHEVALAPEPPESTKKKPKKAPPKEKAADAKAREHTVYSYDEGAPRGETYDLVTKTVSAAQRPDGEEVNKRTTLTAYGGQDGLGWKLRKPTSVTIDPGGLNLTTTTRYDETTGDVTETIPPGSAAALLPLYNDAFSTHFTSGAQLAGPSALTQDAAGDLWVADAANNRIDEFSSSGEFIEAFGWEVNQEGSEQLEVCTTDCRAGSAGKGKGQLSDPRGIAYDPSTGTLFVSNTGDEDILQFKIEGTFKLVNSYGKPAKKQSGKFGHEEFLEPLGLAVASNGDVWIADPQTKRLLEITVHEEYVTEAGAGQGTYAGVALCAGKLFATDTAAQRVDEVSSESKDTILKSFGEAGHEAGQFGQMAQIACDPANHELYVSDSSSDHIDLFTDTGSFLGALASKGSEAGELESPAGLTVAASGATYVADAANNRIAEWGPTTANSSRTHGSRTIYYSAKEESPLEACRDRPEWADLPCQSEPIAEPHTTGIPELPIVSYRYNIWDEVEDTIERTPANGTFPAVTREKLERYDAAGRAQESEVKATPTKDASVPAVTETYNSETGTLEKQSSESHGAVHTITSIYNTIGQLTKYTDASGNTTSYEYEEGGDARLTTVEDGKGTQTYAYNARGELDSLDDSDAGHFAAAYDAEGKVTEEQYPNGMTANYAYNPLGDAAEVRYLQSEHCAHACPETWFSETIVPSIHGETLQKTSTLATSEYTYDNAGRLIEADETPAQKHALCTTRLYTYDEEGNRTSLTKRQAKKCASEGGETQEHAYDSANRLDDPGMSYEELGDITKLPAEDAGGHELTAAFYLDGQVASQTQNEETVEYEYDPAGRTEVTRSTGKTTASALNNYSASGDAISWTGEGSELWTRNIPGIDGSLTATATSSGTITLQLHDLKGDTVATVGLNETKLRTYRSTEFGEPSEEGPPPKYAWLGASGVASETTFGTGVTTQAGASYVPQIARTLQTDPITPPGALPDGAGSGSPYTSTITAADLASAQNQANQDFAEAEAARQRAACENSIEGCVVTEGGDPPFVDEFDISEAAAIAAGILGIKVFSYLNIIDDLARFLHVDFLKQAEEWFIKWLTGVNKEQVESWLYGLAWNLESCVEEAYIFGGRDQHCWVWGQYNEHHVKIPFIEVELFSFPVLDVAIQAEVAFCPYGESGCYPVEEVADYL